MKDYRQLIKELPSKTVVMAFGRFNPPTIGHELLVKAVKKLAQQKNADHVIYASRSQDAKKNPLSVDKKVKYLNLMFKNTHFVGANEHVRTFIEAAKELNKKYKNLVMVAGSDRVPEFKRLLNTYNGKDFNFDTIEVISAGERDPDADDASGMSASKMRAIAVKGNYAEFKKGLPSSVREIDGRRLMNDIREGMNLEPIKEQIILVKDNLREKYFRGEIFNEGDIVESNGETFTIVKRGSNHLLLKEQSGTLVSKWIHDVQPTEEKDMNEALTDKTLRPNDKLKVARIIATMLGVENAETSSNPENLINQALRRVRTKALNPEALQILDKMLNLATEQGIQYDATLKPTKLKEAVKQIDGTDKISTTTDSPVVNKNSNYNIAKDVLRFNDFKKLKKVQEQESKADTKKDTESDIDADHAMTVTDPSEVGHTLVHPGGQDNLRRRKVKYHLGEAISARLKLADALRKEGDKRRASEERAKLMMQQAKEKQDLADTHKKEKENLTKEDVDLSEEKHIVNVTVSDPNHPMVSKRKETYQRRAVVSALDKSSAISAAITHYKKKGYKVHDDHYVGLKEEIEEAFKPGESVKYETSKYSKDNKGTVVSHKGDTVTVKHKDMFGKEHELEVHHSFVRKEEVELDEVAKATGDLKNACWKGYTAVGMKTKNGKKVPNCVPVKEQAEDICPECKEHPCVCDNKVDQTKLNPTFDPFFKESEVDVSDYEEKWEEHIFADEEPSDEELDHYMNHISDDEIMDLYDDEELAIVDDETGEELEADEDEEKKLEESTLMEVLSRVERMKARARIRRTKAKRERATKIALKRYSDTKTINKRSRRLAIKLMKKRLTRGRDPSKLSVGEKERIERIIERRKSVIGRIAMRLAPRVRKVEKARLSHTKYTQGTPNVAF